MPNPKSGTVTLDVGKAVQDIKAGKIDFKVDKFGIIHASIGKVSFTPEKIADNVREMVQTIARLRPASAKGAYFRSINLSSTMSPSITIDKNSISGIKQS
jgi:large subunit ribosomal protein L1